MLLCIAGNFVAVGTMDPVIEIWDLDVMESISPALSLGCPVKKKKKAKKVRSAYILLCTCSKHMYEGAHTNLLFYAYMNTDMHAHTESF